MPQLSLTDFVDIAISNDPIAKVNKMAQIKNRPQYGPAQDYWRALRDTIIDAHRNGQAKNVLDAAVHHAHPNRLGNYQNAVTAYKTWWGRKAITWFDPQMQLYSVQGVDVRVNPELGLVINGQQYLIKLYFKAEQMTSRRAEIILLLMSCTLSQFFPNATMAVLDVQRGHLFTNTNNLQRLQIALNAELSYIATAWPQL